MEEYRLMWSAYYKLPDSDAILVTQGASRLSHLTELTFTEALYTLWKVGFFLAETEDSGKRIWRKK
jgi:hypothetical protein